MNEVENRQILKLASWLALANSGIDEKTCLLSSFLSHFIHG